MSSYNRLTEKLERLLESEHVFECRELTCDIKATFEHGATLWAAFVYSTTGAASEAFDATYAKLIAQYGKRFMASAERERIAFCDAVATIVCEDCNAHTYVAAPEGKEDYYGTRCGSCSATLKGEV